MLYSYEAKDGAGRTVTGSLDAHDARTAATQVRDLGLFPMRVAPLTEHVEVQDTGAHISAGQRFLQRVVFPIWSGVSPLELAMCYRQWAAMLGAGVPLYQSLTTMQAQTNNGTLRRILDTLAADVRRGGKLTDGMARFPWVFTEFHRSIIAAGELTGNLDAMFVRLAQAIEQEMALRRTLKKETLYPKITLACTFLLPPLVLLVTGQARAYFHTAVTPVLWIAGIALMLFVLNKWGAQSRTAYDAVLAHIPSVGGTVRMVALARFARSLSALYAAGVVFPAAVRSAAAACGNAYLGGRMMGAIPAMMSGGGLTQALGSTGVFPPMVMSMLGTGEQTGSLDTAMDKVADFYEQESAARLHQTSVTVGVVTLLISAVFVAIALLHFYAGQLPSKDLLDNN